MWRFIPGLVFLFLSFSALAQGAAPPRSVADILAILDEHKPDPAQVKRLRDTVSRQPPRTTDPVDQAKFYLERGGAAGELGMLQQQLADLRQASRLIPAGDPEQRSILSEITIAELQSGDFDAGMRSVEENYPRVSRFDHQWLTTWSTLTSVRAQTGDLKGARQALSEAEAYLVKLRGSPAWAFYGDGWQALYERARAQVLRFEGKFSEAEADNRSAIALLERYIEAIPALLRAGRSTPTVANTTRNLMLWEHQNQLPVLLEQGKLAEAELLVRGSIKHGLKVLGRDSVDTASALVRLADVLFEQGRFQESTAIARTAIDIYRRLGVAPYSRFLALARRSVGSAFVEEARYPEAIAEFEEMRKGLAQAPSAAETGVHAENPAWIYALVRVKRTAEALELARRYHASELKTFGAHMYSTIESRGFLALALAADGKRDEALREFRAAVPALLAAASERASEEGLGLARTLRRTRLLSAYIELLARFAFEGKTPDGLDALAESFRIADAARGSTVQRALTAASARAAIRDPDLARFAREEQDAGNRVTSLTSVVVDLLARPSDKRPSAIIEKMRADIEALRNRRGELKREIEKRFPDYANLIDPKPVAPEAARALLLPGEALIVLFGTEDRTFVWAVPKEGQVRFHAAALGRNERDQLVATLRKALDVGDAPLERFPRFDVAAAHKLFAELLAPLEPVWGAAKSLLIVPHGSLGQLPFPLLVTKPGEIADRGLPFEGYRQVAWLARRAAITQLPAVNTLASLRTVKRARAPVRPFAGFGDPVFAPQQVAQAAAPGTRALRLRSAAFDDPQAARKAISAQLAQLARLPDTAEELQGIAKALGAAPEQDVFLAAKANETSVKSTDLSDRRVLAFATHGLIPGDLDGLTQPALALSNPQLTGEEESDGLLTMEEILGLRLNADWVVLSACNTAAGAGAEAVSGLGRAFFYAGARALLVSNWPVETVSAKLLTTEVFRRQAADPGLTRAEALRQAMLQLMDSETGKDREGKPLFSYAHPMFWAPFSLVGDGG